MACKGAGMVADTSATAVLDETVAWLNGGLELALAVGRFSKPSEVFATLAQVARDLVGYGSSAVLMIDPRGNLRSSGWSGPGRQLMCVLNDRQPLSVTDTGEPMAPAVRALRTGTSVWVPDLHEDSGCAAQVSAFAAEGLSAAVSVPLEANNEQLGVLECYFPPGRQPCADKLALLERLARVGGVAIDLVLRRYQAEQRILDLEATNRTLSRQVDSREQVQTTDARLMEVLFEEQSLDGLARVLATRLECAAIVEEVGQVQPHTATAGCELLPLSPEAIADGAVTMRGQRPHPSGRATLISSDPTTNMPSGLAVPSLLAGELTGWVSTYRLRSFDHHERQIVERAALVMAALAQRQRAEREVEWRLSREFFDQVLDIRADTDISTVVERGLSLGVDLRRPNIIVIFKIEPDAGHDPGRAAHSSARNTRLITAVQRFVDMSPAHAIAVARADHVVVIHPADESDAVDELIVRLQDQMRAVRAIDSLATVVSTVCREPADYEPNYRAALTALSLKKAGSQNGVVRVPDLGVYALLLNARRPDELAAFAADTTASLRKYDAENGTELLKTLRVYLEERGKLAPTAARLFVHANTVSYRLNRVSEITGGHPNDLDFALRFELAFMIEQLAGTAAVV